MRNYLLYALVGFMLVTPSLFAQTNATATTPIPEEARKHFVMGTTLFKDAKTPDDYAQVESQFKQAVDLAPQWPDARYNLALAKEAAGDYSGAMADLKLYQQFKLSDTEARTAQDKIYAIEAKQQKAVDAANSPAAQLEKLVQSLDGGVWRCVSSDAVNNYGVHYADQDVGHTYIAVSGHMISGQEFRRPVIVNGIPTNKMEDFPYDPSATMEWTATLTSRRFNTPLPDMTYLDRYSDEVTISDDGRSITETIESTSSSSYASGGPYNLTTRRTYVRSR